MTFLIYSNFYWIFICPSYIPFLFPWFDYFHPNNMFLEFCTFCYDICKYYLESFSWYFHFSFSYTVYCTLFFFTSSLFFQGIVIQLLGNAFLQNIIPRMRRMYYYIVDSYWQSLWLFSAGWKASQSVWGTSVLWVCGEWRAGPRRVTSQQQCNG